jgi:hypothetical protein
MLSVDERIVEFAAGSRLVREEVYGFVCKAKKDGAEWRVLVDGRLIRAVVDPKGQTYSDARRVDDKRIVLGRNTTDSRYRERVTMTGPPEAIGVIILVPATNTEPGFFDVFTQVCVCSSVRDCADVWFVGSARRL